MLPMLISYSGGEIVYGKRGAVIGTMGLIVGWSIPMFAGPLGAYLVKKFDKLIDDRIPQGMEMLVNNFSLGIVSMILCLFSYAYIGNAIELLTNVFMSGVQMMVDRSLLIFIPFITEPARMLFLNNAIGHGILTPLGLEQAAETGKSFFFLLAANPGPGVGLLLAYYLYGKGNTKSAAPSAMLIHFYGGIHEMYFPYILMRPKLIISTIAAYMAVIPVYSIFNAGLVAYPSPGSIISILLLTPKGSFSGTYWV